MRRIVKGGADDSYGIEVAKLAGVPQSIINRAKEILSELESGKSEIKTEKSHESDDMQLSLISSAQTPIIDKINSVDINTLTPIEAMNLLYELKKMI